MLDEYKISSFLDQQLTTRGGIVSSYSFISMPLNDMIKMVGGDPTINIKHHGQGKPASIAISGIQESLLDTVYEQYYNPGEHMSDPFNTNKNYGKMDVVKMLYDIEEYT